MIDRDDLALFEASLRRATETSTGADLDAALDDLGWRDALDVDRRAAVSLLFELQGRAASTSAALDHVLARALGIDGSAAVAVVRPPLGVTAAPGRSVAGGIDVRGLATGSIERATEVVVAVAVDGGHALARVAPGELVVRPVGGLDPAAGLVEVGGQGVRAVEGPEPSPTEWVDVVAVAQLALTHELVGAMRAMLALARDHAVERVQFGQPIARFQAVRHRLADAFVAVEAAEAAALAAWDDGSALAAALAKAVAGRSARSVARHCQQVLAGIGFTTEHPLHRYVRRVLVLDRSFGDARTLTATVGAELLRTRRVPSLLPL